MEIHQNQEKGLCRLRPEGEMTIYTATEIKNILCDALTSCQELEIDLSGVTELDTAGAQLLILIKLEATIAGKTLRLSEHSPAVLEVFETFRLARLFGDPMVLAAGPMGRTT